MLQRVELPQWVIYERRFHVEIRGGVSQETNLHRGTEARMVLTSRLLPNIPDTTPIRILEIGAGLSAGIIRCPYEPYRIAALPEKQGRRYDMTIVDINPEVTEDIKTRRTIFRYMEADQQDTQAWNDFLVETNQIQREIHQLEPGLNFEDWVTEFDQATILDTGFLAADIPTTFRKKLDSGNLTVITGDIAVVDLDKYPLAPYHLINATNILIYLRERGQKLSLFNLTSILDEEGFLILTDYEFKFPWMETLFKKAYHGWLTEEDLHNVFDSEIDGNPIKEGDRTTYIIRKLRK